MKITIITIVYNGIDNIGRTIESIIKQKTDGLEYIVIDGKSSDGTVQIVENYLDYIDYFVSEKDDGIADAFNKGIRKASGDFIGLINSGDILLDGVVNDILSLNVNDYDVLYGDSQIFDQDNDRIYSKKAFSIDMINYCLPFSHQSCFISKNAYNKYGLYEKKYKISMDYALIRKMYAEGASFLYIPKEFAMFSTGGVSYNNPVKTMKEDLSIAVKYGLPKRKAFIFGTKHILRHYCKKLLEALGLFKYISRIKDN